jgi:hypothetical protein
MHINLIMKKILFFILSFCVVTTKAQDYMGLQTSNYAGVIGAYSNPANIVDNRLRVDIALIGINFTAANNFIGVKRSALKYTGSLTNPNSIKLPGSWDSTNVNSPYYYKNTNFTVANNSKTKGIYVNNRITLPSFMICLNKKNAIAFNWSLRNYINVDGVSGELATLAYEEFKLSSALFKKLN